MGSYVFPKVEPADIQRANRNLSLYKPFTASVGTLVPVLSVDMLPADWMEINTIATVQSLPMIAPVRGRWKVNFDYYYEPWSNLYGFMDNNTRLSTQTLLNMQRWTMNVGSESTFLLSGDSPTTIESEDLRQFLSKPRVGAGSILDYLGCPVGYQGNVTFSEKAEPQAGTNDYAYLVTITPTKHPAEGFLTYIDIIRNYYVNNQLSEIPFIASVASTNSVASQSYGYKNVSLSKLDEFFAMLRYESSKGQNITALQTSGWADVVPFVTNLLNSSQGVDSTGILRDVNIETAFYSTAGRQCGLFLRNYRMDLLRGIMNSDVGSIESKVGVVTETINGQTQNYVTIDTINFMSKFYQLVSRYDISGGRFADYIHTRWNIDPGIQVDRPIYLGSHSMWLNTIDVVATAAGQSGDDSNNPNTELAQQAGYQVGKMANGKQRPITIRSKQYGTLQCIFSIVPDVVYSQGFELNMLKTKFSDIYDPAFKQIGFQDVLKSEMHAFPQIVVTHQQTEYGDVSYIKSLTNTNGDSAVGKRIAWSEYMASLNRSHGDFAYGESLDYWVNNRIYAKRESVASDLDSDYLESPILRRMYEFDSTTYVYPTLWNHQFADKNLAAMNYIVDVFFAIDANRSLGKRLMPKM